MTTKDPVTTVDPRFSVEGAPAVPWPEARRALEGAGTYWLSTVRADGRPHVTTLIAVWDGDALYFSTGPSEQKYTNLEKNPYCALTTGSDSLEDGLDVVVEGEAVQVTDEARLRVLADAWVAKYGSDWQFTVRDGAFRHDDSPGGDDYPAYVFEVTPVKAFGFRKGFGEDGQGSQTRWTWDRP